jgi:hypothetical protein
LTRTDLWMDSIVTRSAFLGKSTISAMHSLCDFPLRRATEQKVDARFNEALMSIRASGRFPSLN